MHANVNINIAHFLQKISEQVLLTQQQRLNQYIKVIIWILVQNVETLKCDFPHPSTHLISFINSSLGFSTNPEIETQYLLCQTGSQIS
jgi:hypothetical protein